MLAYSEQLRDGRVECPNKEAVHSFDCILNIVLDNTVEIVSPTEKNEIGMVVIRGNSIMMWECLDRVK